MSNPNGAGTSRRMRNTGLVLLALALIAVVVGLVVTTNGEEETPVAEPPLVTSPRAPSSAPPPPSVIPFPPPEIPSPGAVPGPVPPESAAEGPVSANGSSDYSRGEVRVYNNSTIRGLAARAASDLTDAGWTVVEVGNYPYGTIPTTTAYYQEGTDQRADAEALGEQFGMRVEPRFPGIENASPGLIVIVTNDYVSS